MPGWTVHLVEFLLYVGRDVLLNVISFHGFTGTVDSTLLHFLCHISILDNGLTSLHAISLVLLPLGGSDIVRLDATLYTPV